MQKNLNGAVVAKVAKRTTSFMIDEFGKKVKCLPNVEGAIVETIYLATFVVSNKIVQVVVQEKEMINILSELKMDTINIDLALMLVEGATVANGTLLEITQHDIDNGTNVFTNEKGVDVTFSKEGNHLWNLNELVIMLTADNSKELRTILMSNTANTVAAKREENSKHIGTLADLFAPFAKQNNTLSEIEQLRIQLKNETNAKKKLALQSKIEELETA